MSGIEPTKLMPIGRVMDDDLYKCVHCGLCLNVCPTYLETGLETESPRGRIALMKGLREGRVETNRRVVSHWDLCLGCRACEAACPSGVPYGRLIEGVREEVGKRRGTSIRQRLVYAVFLRGLLRHLWVLRFLVWGLRWYQRLGFQSVIRRSRILRLLPGPLHKLEGQMPRIPSRFFGSGARVYSAIGQKRMRVGLLAGCVMPLVHSPTMEAAVRVLQRNGCEVVVPGDQGCCGALNLHSGEARSGRRMARKNVDAFLAAEVERVVVASAGCGSAMKEYGHLLKDDASYAEKAGRLGEITVDITEFLGSLPLVIPSRSVNMKVTYQDPCHLAHAQGITDAPRRIMDSIPGLELVEMENSSLCCGAAGIYTITQRAMSGQLLESKMSAVEATGAGVVATANPGCALQLEAGLRMSGSDGRVCHVVDLWTKRTGWGKTRVY